MAQSTPPTTDARLTTGLNQVLADSYAVLSLTHLAHWNLEGPGFVELASAFQAQHEELFAAIDEIAERLRARGAYAVGEQGTLVAVAQTVAQIKEFASPLTQEDYIRALMSANNKLLADAARVRDIADELNDDVSRELMVARITLHEGTVALLQSFLDGL